MSFLTALALLGGLLAAAPVAAHLLRRRRAKEIELPTASLLAATPPAARRRSALEDRALLAIRVIAVLLLAVLGATPFVSCSRIALARRDGASVAMVFVLDDSLSMTAPDPNGKTRFERAKQAALDLIDDAEPGDSFAVILGGAEPRVLLAATTDARAAYSAVKEVEPSDRATDLVAAVAIARDMLRGVPQPDRRVVLLSDLADGAPSGPALDAGPDATLWYPVVDLESRPEANCAITATLRRDPQLEVTVKCAGPSTAREIQIVAAADAKSVLVSTPVPEGAEVVSLKLPADAPEDLDARLTPADRIPGDDVAPVAVKPKTVMLGVLVDAAAAKVETGGPPPVEQAFAALEAGTSVRPISSIPEHADELKPYAGLVLDDPPGLTPEERKTVTTWVEGGGLLLLSLGKKASSAPLGAGFGALVPGVIRWSPDAPKGAKPEACGFFGPSADGLADLAPKGRTLMPPEATKDAETLCAFEDGSPLLSRRPLGKGAIYVTTLPFDFETSDFPLRPAFLVLLDSFHQVAQSGGGAKVVEAGGRFHFPGAKTVKGQVSPPGSATSLSLEIQPGTSLRADAPRVGRYLFEVDGVTDSRLALPAEREVDLAPRAIATDARDPSLGGETRKLDASPYVPFGLLALLLLELIVRLLGPTPAPVEERAATPET